MWTPATAMLWEWWRMTCRQVLFCGAIGSVAGWAMMARTEEAARASSSYVVFILLITAATLAWASMLARNARTGFPLPLGYGRPVRTSLLVAVPMLYLALACAATYTVPAAVLRVAYGAPFPLLPVAVLLAAGAAVFCAGNWFTRASAPRFLATIAWVVAIGPALRWLDAWNVPPAGAFPPPLAVDSVSLGIEDYAVVALVVVAAYVAAVFGVGRQRHGDDGASQRATATRTSRAPSKGIVERFRDAALAVVRVPCPTSSPLAAEIWVEAKSRGLPVLAIGVLLAVCMPFLLMLGNAAGSSGALVLIGFAAVSPFFAGIGASFWNRDSSLRAPMSGFEAVRPATTARLAAVQIAVAVTSMLGAWILVGASLWWSAPLFADVVDFAPAQRALVATLAGWSLVRLAATAIVGVVVFTTFVALLATIRAFSVLYGLRLWLGAIAVTVYLIVLAFGIAVEWWSEAVIGPHFWGFAAAVPIATAFVTIRAVADRALQPAQVAALAGAWVLFAGALVLTFRGGGAVFAGLSPAVAALTLAAALLPLTGSALSVWSLHRIRHT